ncbi:integrase catalytic domain-containing protein [Trichonephila clavata]|uniref:Integrase catalytic domain-containing protein n=1 Tax=Trichonephila clavata TaxID=2740835 RepID=A0A8X6GTG2_TRICU|nr:integrase catalytic domain-containing protein [Trichonephila clavata]
MSSILSYKKKRAAFKSSTTKLLKRIEESKDSVDSSELDDLLNLSQSKIDNVKILDDQIVDLIDVNDIETEIERSEEYYEKLITNRCMLQRKMNDLSLGLRLFLRKELLCKELAKLINSGRKNRRENLNYYRENSSATELLANSQTIVQAVLEIRKEANAYGFNQSSPRSKRGVAAGNEDKTTTKIRIVFDGSSHGENQLSLNDCLNSGVKSNPDLLELILKFREDPIAAVARIFDPERFLSPVVIRMKILLQDIWTSGIDWNEELPCSLKSKWTELCSEIPELKYISISRYYLWNMKNEIESVALHSFSDNSKRGYGCVIYLQIVCKNGTIGTSFVASKIYCWVTSRPDRFKPFIKNNVEEIQKLSTSSDWNHCQGKENPVDFLTRGLSVKNLKKCDALWNGPHWLHQPEENWPKSEVEGVEERNLELRKKSEKTIQNHLILDPNDHVLNLKKYSILNKVLRVIAWILRFLTNSRRNNIKDSYLQANEIELAEI